MLKLEHISKAYTTGDFTQVALDDVSVSFRDSEFVAVLGPSGSGKTTLLNIIGGLDHYDTGTITIDGISTDNYKDRDWDTYRNNRIGFVFQSYNLIPHQTVLANVELALTLSGVSREERRARATEALEKVGLGEHIHKRPNQLSGGQMQRVAIARALINNPEILLADEPTGALDSKTSVAIMDLLTEIANERLVIMVTHNPDLADEYATRIVNLADGHIVADTNPFNPTDEEMRLSEKPIRRTAMSFLTALSLSFNNLMTKKGRTIMTAFAGSIGIIGIAAILALANGVNNYIKNTEEETLSEYPLQINSTGFDMTALLTGATGNDDASGESASNGDGGGGGETENAGENIDGAEREAADEADGGGQVGIAEMLTTMFSSVGANDLASLKTYLEDDRQELDPYINAIEYSYDVAPQLFSSDLDNLRQVNPDRSLAPLGIGSTNTSNSLMSMVMSTDVFYEMPSDPSLYENSYEILAGSWPQNYNEVVLVTTASGRISDFMLYTLGLRSASELDDMVRAFAAEETVTIPTDIQSVSYDQILGITFKLVNAADYYQRDDEHNVWIDKYDDNTYMHDLVAAGEDVTVVGIVKPDPDAKATMLSPGLNYPSSLVTHVIDDAATKPIVQSQLANPGVNVFTGRNFGEEEPDNEFDMASLFTINTTALRSAFVIDESALAGDMSQSLDLGSLSMPSAPAPSAPAIDTSGLTPTIDGSMLAPAISGIIAQALSGFPAWYRDHLDLPQEEALAQYLADPSTQAIISEGANAMAAQIVESSSAASAQFQSQLQSQLESYMTSTLQTYLGEMTSAMQRQVSAAMQSAMSQMSANMASAISIDSSAFANAFELNMSENDIVELMTSMMNTEEASYNGNLSELGYADSANPAGIDIYPIDFESKERVIEVLNTYNADMEAAGQDEKVITYTDFVGTLMASVTEIIEMISAMLIAFVSISLIVSSIMIGVITYISVLERKKEIGILRAIGASKLNISEVFNAETVIEGFIAGLLGVGITAIGCIPASAIVYSIFNVPDIAQLPWEAALILIFLSVLLTFLAGLIPASSASRKDPVEALRSE